MVHCVHTIYTFDYLTLQIVKSIFNYRKSS